MTYFPRRYFPARYFPAGFFGGALDTIPHLSFVGRLTDNIWLYAEWMLEMDLVGTFAEDLELSGLLTDLTLDGAWEIEAALDAQHKIDLELSGAIEMSVKNAKVDVHAGNRRNLNITVKDAAGVVVDLTGYSAAFKLLKMTGGAPVSPPALTKASGSGITFPTPANGVVRVVIATGDTDDFFGLYHWELELTDPSSDTNVVATGLFNFLKNY